MKLALFADIHSNLEAIHACLAHAQALGADRYAFLGDLVGYGADPVAVLDLIEGYADQGAIVLLGNHDAAALGHGADGMNAYARTAIDWTRERLGARQRAFLAALPLTLKEGNIRFVHASAAAPENWTYVTSAVEAQQSMAATDASYIFCGHVHEQALYFAGAGGQTQSFLPTAGAPIPATSQRQWLAVVGSAGQPRDGNNAACYTLFDQERERLTFYRVRYDYRIAAQKIRGAGLPERLARRLERGA